MTDTRKTRYRVDRNGFGATVMIGHEGTWVVGSCQAPPLGTAEEMGEYSAFIAHLVHVVHLLSKGTLTPDETTYIKRYCK